MIIEVPLGMLWCCQSSTRSRALPAAHLLVAARGEQLFEQADDHRLAMPAQFAALIPTWLEWKYCHCSRPGLLSVIRIMSKSN